MPDRSKRLLQFDIYLIDLDQRLVLCGKTVIPLAPKVFDTLLVLVQSQGQLVEKDKLIQKVWPDSFVEEGSLSRNISTLRKALSAGRDDQKYIQTVAKRGYRFVAAVYQPTEEQPEALGPAGNTLHGSSTENTGSSITGPAPGSHLLNRRSLIWAGGAAILTGTAVWLADKARLREPARAVRVVVQLPEGTSAADPGRLLGYPAIAPDGRSMVTPLKTTSGEYLYIRSLDSDRLMRMEGTQGASLPFWSPDSQHIGFFADAKLKRISSAGGDTTVLCDAAEARGGSWSKRGVILFSAAPLGGFYQKIFRVSELGGKALPVTHLNKAAGENSHRFPVFFPDANRFLYFIRSDSTEAQGIYINSVDGQTKRRRLVVADWQFALGFHKEEQSYYLLSQQEGKIIAQHFDIARGELSGRPQIVLDHAGTVSVSDTGVLLTHADLDGLSRLLWRDRAGRELGTLGTRADYWCVGLSPDDGFAAVVKRNYLNGEFILGIFSIAHGFLEPFSDSHYVFSFLWSRGGDTIYYTDFRKSKLLRRRISPRGPEEVECELPGSTHVEDISPDRHYAIGEVMHNSARSQVTWTDLKDGAHASTWHLMNASGPWGLLPSFSADGRWLAFCSYESGSAQIYVTDFPGGSLRQRISIDGGQMPRWRRDGNELFYIAADGNLMVVEISGGNRLRADLPKKLFLANQRLVSPGPVYDVTRDGQRFLVVDGGTQRNESTIEAILNWPSLLRR